MNIHPCLTPDQAEAVVDYGLNILPKPQLRHVQMPRITLHRRNQRADVNVRIPKLPHECTWRTRPLNLLRIKLRKMLNNHFRLRQNWASGFSAEHSATTTVHADGGRGCGDE